MYFKIMHAKLELPDTLDNDTKSLLAGLLERDPSKRLGDAAVIKTHPYFKSIDWDKILRKEIKPPYIPPVVSLSPLYALSPSY
jgi:serum/glucocorticoid-regulated kinase 2